MSYFVLQKYLYQIFIAKLYFYEIIKMNVPKVLWFEPVSAATVALEPGGVQQVLPVICLVVQSNY